MNERMYWGLLALIVVLSWRSLGELRRYLVLRTKLAARELEHRERVAAIAAARSDLPEPRAELFECPSEFGWAPCGTRRKLILLCGLTLVLGGCGLAAALRWYECSNHASVALIPICIGFGFLIYWALANRSWPRI